MSADFKDIAVQSEINARLRDAAPELLEALKAARRSLWSGGACLDQVDAAIAKAEGR
jgi:hypothetical protein